MLSNLKDQKVVVPHITTVREMAANENGTGSLSGWEIKCTCGHSITTTLGSQVQRLQHEHLQYWLAKDDATIRSYYGYSKYGWERHLSDSDRAKLRAEYHYDTNSKANPRA